MVTGGEPAGIAGQFALASGRPRRWRGRVSPRKIACWPTSGRRGWLITGRWQLSSDKVSVDSACLSKLPGGDASSAPLALDQLQRELPSLDLTLNDLTLIPRQRYAGKLQLSSGLTGNACIIRGRISAPRRSWMKTAADVAKFDHCPAQQRATAAPRRQDNHSAGFGQPADAGRVAGEMQTAYLEKPVLLDMRWQQQQGVLTVSEKATIARWRCCRGKSRRSGSASSRAVALAVQRAAVERRPEHRAA